MTSKERQRLEDTFRKFPHLRPADWEEIIKPEQDIRGDICPNCSGKTLIHESGCVKCMHCGWSACG